LNFPQVPGDFFRGLTFKDYDSPGREIPDEYLTKLLSSNQAKFSIMKVSQGNLAMVNHHPDKHLEIKKGQLWELWLVNPSREVILGVFPTLEELNRAQITLYHAWENSRYPQDPPLELN
jgi:hypothetical protein